jgi:DNA polymerase III psi subunit
MRFLQENVFDYCIQQLKIMDWQIESNKRFFHNKIKKRIPNNDRLINTHTHTHTHTHTYKDKNLTFIYEEIALLFLSMELFTNNHNIF